MILPVPIFLSKKSSNIFAAIIAAPFLFAYFWLKQADEEEENVRLRQIDEEKLVQERFK